VAATPNAYCTSLVEQMTQLYEQTRTSQLQTEAKLAELSEVSREPTPNPADTNNVPRHTSGTDMPPESADRTTSRGVIPAERNSAVPPITGATLSSGATPVNKSVVMRLKEFDGKQSVNSFLSHFEVCARFNKWGEDDKQMWLQWSLKDRAQQILWYLPGGTSLSFAKCQKHYDRDMERNISRRSTNWSWKI